MCETVERIVEETAYHEAGHAVLAIASGVEISYLSIIPDGSLHGSCEVGYEAAFVRAATKEVMQEIDIPLALLRYIAFLAAGRQAQRKFLSSRNICIEESKLNVAAQKDYELIDQKLKFLKNNDHEQIDLAYLLQQIDQFFQRVDVWSVVQALATKLVRAKEIYDISQEEYHVPSFTPSSCENKTQV